MLDAKMTQQIGELLEKISASVELVASVDDSPKSVELMDLLETVAGLSERITVRADGDAERRPSFAIQRAGSDVAVSFAAIPLGHELSSLVLALLQVGGHPPAVAAETLEQIRQLEGPLRFETFVSLSCQNCPDVVQALNLMSIVNPAIEHVTIDGALFPDEVEARSVLAVPTVLLNGEPFDQGRMTLDQILGKLDDGLADRTAELIDAKDPFDLLIVGGGPAGTSAAVYAARKGLRTGLVAETLGGQLLDTLGIENLISVPYTEGPALAAELEQNVRAHRVDVMTSQRAATLVPATDDQPFGRVELESGATLHARSVVVSTGARWRKLGVPGEEEYANRGVAYCPHCDGPLYRDKRVAVIGGGNSGVEAAIDLAGVAAQVTLIEFADELRADEVLQAKLRSLPNVDVIVGAETTEVIGDGTRVVGLEYRTHIDGASHRLELDGVFVQIGLSPNTEWLDGVVELSDHGEIEIDERGRTSVTGVFAAGDCTTVPYKQIVVSMGAGSTAVLAAFDHLIRTSAPAAA